MIRTRKGRLPEAARGRRRGRSPTGAGPGKGAPGGNQGGGNRSPPPPRRAKTRIAQRERLQRRARSPAGDVPARPRAGAAPGRALIPRAQRADRKTYLYEAPAPGRFPPLWITSGNQSLIAYRNKFFHELEGINCFCCFANSL